MRGQSVRISEPSLIPKCKPPDAKAGEIRAVITERIVASDGNSLALHIAGLARPDVDFATDFPVDCAFRDVILGAVHNSDGHKGKHRVGWRHVIDPQPSSSELLAHVALHRARIDAMFSARRDAPTRRLLAEQSNLDERSRCLISPISLDRLSVD